MLHSLFTSFYVDYFVRHTFGGHDGNPTNSLTVFSIGQLAYAMWNGLNDVGFGWCNDNFFKKLERRRWNRLAFGGPMWAIVFACLWLPSFQGGSILGVTIHPAVEFALMMMLYDGFFSYTTVAFRALLTDITTNPRERELCNAYAAVFHVIGSLGVGVAGFLYEQDRSLIGKAEMDDLAHFRVFMCIWSALAAVGFLVASSGAAEIVMKKIGRDSPVSVNIVAFAKEALTKRSMVIAVIVWAVQEYSCTFATNFFAMFLALVCRDSLSTTTRSALLMLSFVAPHAITLGITPLIASVGKKVIIERLFLLRALVGVCTLVLAFSMSNAGSQSRSFQVLFALALFGNRILTEGVCRLQSLVLSDVTDEDTVSHNRERSMAATVNGLMSLVSKPFQSVAPVVTCFILATQRVLLADDAASTTDPSKCIATLLGATALITAGSMWVVWRRYPLHGSYLHHIQMQMKLRQDVKAEDKGRETV